MKGKAGVITVHICFAAFLGGPLKPTSAPPSTTGGQIPKLASIMERNMTAAALNEYLQQDPALGALAGKLEPSVDGDLLINNVELLDAKQVVPMLQSYISGDVGLIGKLVIKIKNFLASEKAASKKVKKGKKRTLDEAKEQRTLDEAKDERLERAMMKERVGKVSSGTLNELFQAHVAQDRVDGPARRAAARAMYEKDGIVFKLTVPAAKHLIDQKHFAFYAENKQSLLQKVGFELVSTQPVPGGKTEDKLRVPGSFLKVVFKEREALKEDLRLDGAHGGRPDLRTGPYGCTQFMSLVCQMRKDAYARAPRIMCTSTFATPPPGCRSTATMPPWLPPCHPVRACARVQAEGGQDSRVEEVGRAAAGA